MNCDDCRQQTEAYFDLELDARTTERVATHLAACAACASLLDELQAEAEVYKTYERDIELSPALWTAIESRLAIDLVARRVQERDSTSWLRAWSAFAFASPRLVLGATAVAAIFACLIASVALYNGKRDSASQTQIAGAQGSIGQPYVLNREATASKVNAAHESIPEGQDRVLPRATPHHQADQSHVRASIKTKESDTADVNKWKRTTTRATLDGIHRRVKPQIERELAPTAFVKADVVIVAELTKRLSETPGDFEDVWQRHAEQSQLLLRSFRNARSSRGETVDVAYERAQAQGLLNRNVVLRRDAARRGRVLTEESLSRLEPVLLDIANLPVKTSMEDVRAVNARINEGEFVATLRVQASLLARAN